MLSMIVGSKVFFLVERHKPLHYNVTHDGIDLHSSGSVSIILTDGFLKEVISVTG